MQSKSVLSALRIITSAGMPATVEGRCHIIEKLRVRSPSDLVRFASIISLVHVAV